MRLALQGSPLARWAVVLSSAVMFLAFTHAPILRQIGFFLVVEDPLQPAAAIVPLGGQIPFREIEAAKLYRDGWAPVIFIVAARPREEAKALEKMGIKMSEQWDLRREVLLRQGVPGSAIVAPQGEAIGTLEELGVVYQALGAKDSSVILVTSKYHTRRTRLTWDYVTGGRSKAVVRAAAQDPFDPKQWWRERRFFLSVVREYLGLINYYSGFPVGERDG